MGAERIIKRERRRVENGLKEKEREMTLQKEGHRHSWANYMQKNDEGFWPFLGPLGAH